MNFEDFYGPESTFKRSKSTKWKSNEKTKRLKRSQTNDENSPSPVRRSKHSQPSQYSAGSSPTRQLFRSSPDRKPFVELSEESPDQHNRQGGLDMDMLENSEEEAGAQQASQIELKLQPKASPSVTCLTPFQNEAQHEFKIHGGQTGILSQDQTLSEQGLNPSELRHDGSRASVQTGRFQRPAQGTPQTPELGLAGIMSGHNANSFSIEDSVQYQGQHLVYTDLGQEPTFNNNCNSGASVANRELDAAPNQQENHKHLLHNASSVTSSTFKNNLEQSNKAAAAGTRKESNQSEMTNSNHTLQSELLKSVSNEYSFLLDDMPAGSAEKKDATWSQQHLKKKIEEMRQIQSNQQRQNQLEDVKNIERYAQNLDIGRILGAAGTESDSDSSLGGTGLIPSIEQSYQASNEGTTLRSFPQVPEVDPGVFQNPQLQLPEGPESDTKPKSVKKIMTIIQEEEFEESLKVPHSLSSSNPRIVRNFQHVKKKTLKYPISSQPIIPQPETYPPQDDMKLEDLGDVNEHDEIKEPIMFNQDSSDLQINQKSLVHSSENETSISKNFRGGESSSNGKEASAARPIQFMEYFEHQEMKPRSPEHQRSPSTTDPEAKSETEEQSSPSQSNKSQIQQTSVQKMLDKYQSKYVQDKLIKSQMHAVSSQKLIIDKQKQIEKVKDHFLSISHSVQDEQNREMQSQTNTDSEFDPSETGSSVRYINRTNNKIEKGTRENVSMKKSEQEYTAGASSIEKSSWTPELFVRTYGLDGSISLEGSTRLVETWILIAHRLAEQMKTKDLTIKKLEHKLTSTKSLWSSDVQQSQKLFQQQLDSKQAEVVRSKRQMEIKEEQLEAKLVQLRDRLKCSEKQIYQQIEKEYSSLLKSKDEQLKEQSEQITQVQGMVAMMSKQIQQEQKKMLVAHEVAREQDRADLEEHKKKVEEEARKDIAKEIKRMKEIFGQEYEFKVQHLEEVTALKEKQQLQTLEREQKEFMDTKETEYRALILNEKAKIQRDKAKNHAQATQELYEDIYKTLKEKLVVESKAKLSEITSKLKQSFEQRVNQIERQQHLSLTLERQKCAKLEMATKQHEREISEQVETIEKLEKKNKENKSKQDLSFQLVNNLQPKTGADGNCKRCEALIFANGLYIEKIKKLTKSIHKYEKAKN